MPHLINWGKCRHPSPRHPCIHGAEMTDASAYSSNPQKSCWTNNRSVLCQSRRQLTLAGKKQKKTKWSWRTSSSFALWFMEKLKCWLQNIVPFPEPDQRLSRGQFFLRNAAVKTETPSRAGSFDRFLESKMPKQQTAVVWFPRVTVMCSLQTINEKPKYDKLRRLVIGLYMKHFAWNLDDLVLQGKARAA